jgi:hypothetical protein
MLYREESRRDTLRRQVQAQSAFPLDRELYLEWARSQLASEKGPTNYQRYLESLQPYDHRFLSTLYHVDWITHIEPADSEHASVGLRALISPLIFNLGLTKTEYKNALQPDRYRFFSQGTIERRFTLAEFSRLTEFVQIDTRTNTPWPVDLRASGTERLLLELNFTGTEHRFISPSDVDSAGLPFLPTDMHAPGRSSNARLYVHTDVTSATRVLIPCSEIFRTFYNAGNQFMTRALDGAYRRRSPITSDSTVGFDGIGFHLGRKGAPSDRSEARAARRYAEAELHAITLRAVRTNQNEGFFALEVAPPVRGTVHIEAHAIVYRTGPVKTIFLSRLLSASRPCLRFPESVDRLRPWPSRREPWQLSLPMDGVLNFRHRSGSGPNGGDRCKCCGRPGNYGSAAWRYFQ